MRQISGRSGGARIWRQGIATAAYACLFVLLTRSCAFAWPPREFQANLDKIFQPLVDPQLSVEQRYVGLVVGIICGNDDRILGYGSKSIDDSGPMTKETVFGIGSMTKVFTSLLLADLVVRNKITLADPIGKFLSIGPGVSAYDGTPITLLDLATHRSGLPGMPSNNPSPKSDPFGEYAAAMLYTFLQTYELDSRPGTAYEYSNLGSALLGHAIERMEARNYECLVQERICAPLGLRDTTTTLSREQRGRLSTSYRDGAAVKEWHFDVLVPCGGLHSTMADMVIFVKANTGVLRSRLSLAIDRMQKVVPGPSPDDKTAMALTWRINRKTGVVWHAGVVHGNQTFLAFDRGSKTGVVILSNTYHSATDALKLGGFKAMSVLRRSASE